MAGVHESLLLKYAFIICHSTEVNQIDYLVAEPGCINSNSFEMPLNVWAYLVRKPATAV